MQLKKAVVALTAIGVMGAASTASAAPVTVGSPMTLPFTLTNFNTVGTVANSALGESGAHATSPIDGTLRRWRVIGAGTLTLRVLHLDGSGAYSIAASSAPQTFAASSAPQTVAASLPIHAGDLIALENASGGDQLGVNQTAPGSTFAAWVPPLAAGQSRAPDQSVSGAEVAFNADVVATPTVTAISPASGPGGGGTPVVITGTDFTDASAVTFGGTQAGIFTVNSDTQITAIAPAGGAGTVDVRVTTPSGQSPVADADHFTYEAPTPPPPPPSPTKLSLAAAKATSTGVRLQISCAGPAGSTCGLAAKLTSTERKRGAKILGVAAALRRVKVTAGKKAVTVPANQTVTVTVPLNRTGKRLLKRFKRLPVTLTGTYTGTNAAPGALKPKRLAITAKHKK